MTTLLRGSTDVLLTADRTSAMLDSSLEGLVNPQYGRAMRRSEYPLSQLPLNSCASQPSPDKDAQSLEAQKLGGNFVFHKWTVLEGANNTDQDLSTLNRSVPMKTIPTSRSIGQLIDQTRSSEAIELETINTHLTLYYCANPAMQGEIDQYKNAQSYLETVASDDEVATHLLLTLARDQYRMVFGHKWELRR